MKDFTPKQSILIVAAGAGFLLLAIYLFSPLFATASRTKADTTQLEETELAMALNQYLLVFHQFPTNDNAFVAKSLTGDNGQQVTFLNLGPTSTNQNGQLIDIWSTPYKFTFHSTNSFTITSAGEDRTFGDGDDVLFNSASNSLPTP